MSQNKFLLNNAGFSQNNKRKLIVTTYLNYFFKSMFHSLQLTFPTLK